MLGSVGKASPVLHRSHSRHAAAPVGPLSLLVALIFAANPRVAFADIPVDGAGGTAGTGGTAGASNTSGERDGGSGTAAAGNGRPTPHRPVVNRLNLRVGASSSELNGRPTICMDVKIALGFDVESCGTGQAIIHNDPGQEMAHFRVNYAWLSRSVGKGTLLGRAGVGFAEMQVGKDNPGFVFGKPDADRGSLAGPETSLSAQWLVPMYKSLDFVVTGTAGVAYFANAKQLVIGQNEVQGFVSIDAGLGW